MGSKVQFFEVSTETGKESLVGEMEMKDGKVVIRGEEWFVEHYKKEPQFARTDTNQGDPLTPEDGGDFIAAAYRSAANGSYFFARKVEEGDAEAEPGGE